MPSAVQVFSQVRAELPPLIAALRAAPAASAPDAAWLDGDWDVKRQAELCMDVVRDLGFDEQVGRLDVSVHPFTGGADPTDVRMTTRFKEHDIMEGLTGAVHECGHALYEQGRNPDAAFVGLPASAALSMGVHESQSLLWERMVALSPEFCAWLMPKAQAAFPEFGKGKTPEVRAARSVQHCGVSRRCGMSRRLTSRLTACRLATCRWDCRSGAWPHEWSHRGRCGRRCSLRWRRREPPLRCWPHRTCLTGAAGPMYRCLSACHPGELCSTGVAHVAQLQRE